MHSVSHVVSFRFIHVFLVTNDVLSRSEGHTGWAPKSKRRTHRLTVAWGASADHAGQHLTSTSGQVLHDHVPDVAAGHSAEGDWPTHSGKGQQPCKQARRYLIRSGSRK